MEQKEREYELKIPAQIWEDIQWVESSTKNVACKHVKAQHIGEVFDELKQLISGCEEFAKTAPNGLQWEIWSGGEMLLYGYLDESGYPVVPVDAIDVRESPEVMALFLG